MANLSSTNQWHSTATHATSSIAAKRSYSQRPSIPLSDISTNMNSAATAALTTFSRKCIYVKEGRNFICNVHSIAFLYRLVISVNNSAAHLPFTSSDSGSASECESGELSSDEYPSQIKIKPISISHGQENHQLESTHEMGTLAQLLNHSFPLQKDSSITSHKFVFEYSLSLEEFLFLGMNQIFIVMKFLIIVYVLLHLHRLLDWKMLVEHVVYQNIYLRLFNDKNHVMNNVIMLMHN